MEEDKKVYGDSYAAAEERIMGDDEYSTEGVNPALIRQRAEEMFNNLTFEELQGFTSQGLSTEDIKEQLIEKATTEMQGPRL